MIKLSEVRVLKKKCKECKQFYDTRLFYTDSKGRIWLHEHLSVDFKNGRSTLEICKKQRVSN